MRTFRSLRVPFCLIVGVVGALLLGGNARAAPIVWHVVGLTLTDGATASGTFTFDSDAGPACTTTASPCGLFSNVDIVTTSGSALPSATYTTVCGTNVAACTGVRPDSTEVLFLTSTASNQQGNPALAMFFAPIGATPPAGLTDAGGIIDISNSGPDVGAVQEAACADPACSTPAAPSRSSIAGFVVAPVPEPATIGLLLAGFGAMAILRRRRATPRG